MLHPSLACYSRVLDPSLVCYSRVLDHSLTHVLEAHGHGPARAARGKLIRPCMCAHPPRYGFRCFALALRTSALSVSLLCTRCSVIRALISKPPCFFSEPAPRYLLRAPCSLLSSSKPPPRYLLRTPCSLLSPSALCSPSLRALSSETPGSLLSPSERRSTPFATCSHPLSLRALCYPLSLHTLFSEFLRSLLRASRLSALTLRASALFSEPPCSLLRLPSLRTLYSRPPPPPPPPNVLMATERYTSCTCI